MFTFIDSIEDLSFLNEELLLLPHVGVDTEFKRTNKDNMRLALLQINDGQEIYIVDTILIENPKESCSFLFSESVVKIFHSCKEDQEAIFSWTGKQMQNLFDTQLAEAFLGGFYSISYQGLVEEKMEITVDKKETRSNWIRRPLTDSQLNYAASDVEFLIDLFLQQKKSLDQSKKITWFREELEFLSSKIFSCQSYEEEINSSLTRVQEQNLLNEFNTIVNKIAKREEINPTMFFSKKNQKNFLRLTLNDSFEVACNGITTWRKKLLEIPFNKLLVTI